MRTSAPVATTSAGIEAAPATAPAPVSTWRPSAPTRPGRRAHAAAAHATIPEVSGASQRAVCGSDSTNTATEAVRPGAHAEGRCGDRRPAGRDRRRAKARDDERSRPCDQRPRGRSRRDATRARASRTPLRRARACHRAYPAPAMIARSGMRGRKNAAVPTSDVAERARPCARAELVGRRGAEDEEEDGGRDQCGRGESRHPDAAHRACAGEDRRNDEQRSAGIRRGVELVGAEQLVDTNDPHIEQQQHDRDGGDALGGAGKAPRPQQPRDREHEHARRGDDHRAHLEARDEVGDEEEHDRGDRDEHHAERQQQHLHARSTTAGGGRRHFVDGSSAAAGHPRRWRSEPWLRRRRLDRCGRTTAPGRPAVRRPRSTRPRRIVGAAASVCDRAACAVRICEITRCRSTSSIVDAHADREQLGRRGNREVEVAARAARRRQRREARGAERRVDELPRVGRPASQIRRCSRGTVGHAHTLPRTRTDRRRALHSAPSRRPHSDGSVAVQ